MYNFPIKQCPKCGCRKIRIRQRIYAIGAYTVDLETEEINTENLHNGLQYKNIGKYAVCD